MISEKNNENGLSRRSVICGITLVALGLLPNTAIASGNVKVLADGKVEIDLTKNSTLRKVGGVIEFQNGNEKSLALIRTSSAQNGFRAIDLSCTHQGVTVERSGAGWKCKLGHGAEYALAGAVTMGPATQNLRQVKIKVFKNKVVVG